MIAKVIQSPQVSQQLLSWGLGPVGSSQEVFAQIIKSDLTLWESIIKETGITIE